MPRHHRAEIIGVALLAVLALLTLVRRDLFVGDETKYAQVVREMHADGAILLPTLNGEPYTHKPPLHFWMMYALTGALGQRAIWPYVIPAFLSGIVLVWMTGRIAANWLGATAAWPARFAIAGLAMTWGLAQTARMDLLFVCLTTAGSVALFRHFDEGRNRDAVLAGVWFGIAGLVKGPMAILILAAVYVTESLALRRRPRPRDLVLGALAAAVPLTWFVPAVVSAGLPYFEEIVTRQTAGRVVGSWVHRQPFWYYLVAAPAITFPWFFVLVSGMRTARGSVTDRVPLARCIRWIVAILVPFSLISSKLPVYMVPAFPPVAILAGWYANLAIEKMAWRPFALWGHRVLALLSVLTAVVLLSGIVPAEGDAGALLGVSGIRAGLVSMAVLGIGGLVFGWRSVRRSGLLLPFTIAIPLGIGLAFGAPAVNDLASSRLLAEEVERQVRPGERVAMYYTPHLWSRTLPTELESARQITPDDLAAGGRPDILAVRSDRADRLGATLDDYRVVSSVRMMGKRFDVYRRR